MGYRRTIAVSPSDDRMTKRINGRLNPGIDKKKMVVPPAGAPQAFRVIRK